MIVKEHLEKKGVEYPKNLETFKLMMMDSSSSIKLVKKLIHKPDVKLWCKLPYPNHPKGCPMFGTRPKCPMQSSYVTDIFDLSKPIYLVCVEFDLIGHVERMRKRHPDWSERQLRNCLYWQSRPKKQLKLEVIKLVKSLRATAYTVMPESIGINVYRTCYLVGLHLEPIKTLRTCRFIGFVGYSNKNNHLNKTQ